MRETKGLIEYTAQAGWHPTSFQQVIPNVFKIGLTTYRTEGEAVLRPQRIYVGSLDEYLFAEKGDSGSLLYPSDSAYILGVLTHISKNNWDRSWIGPTFLIWDDFLRKVGHQTPLQNIGTVPDDIARVISKRWSLLTNAQFSYDFAKLGTGWIDIMDQFKTRGLSPSDR